MAPLLQQLWRFCAEYVLGTRFELLVYSPSQATATLAARVARTEIERLNQAERAAGQTVPENPNYSPLILNTGAYSQSNVRLGTRS